MLCLLSILLVGLLGDAAKVGVFVSTLTKNQVLFGYQLASALTSDQNEVVIVRPEVNPYLRGFSPDNFKEISLDVFSDKYEVFHDFVRVKHDFIFDSAEILPKRILNLKDAFWNLIRTGCMEAISSKKFLNTLKAQHFDYVYVDHHQHCAAAIAQHLNVRYSWFSSSGLGTTFTQFLGIPQFIPLAPAWFLPSINDVDWLERVYNLLLKNSKTYEEWVLDSFDPMYKEHFGDRFPSARQLSQNAELVLANSEELLDYSRPDDHKTIYIGGIGEELAETTGKLSKELAKFVDSNAVVLISCEAVANSTLMSFNLKNELKKLFYLKPDVQFIWKYDGKDVDTPSNVLISECIPQTNLLRSGKISLLVTHGDYNSLSEGFYSATPMLLAPLFGDQFTNVNLAKERGLGVVLRRADIQAEFLSEQIDRMLGNSSYQKSAQKYQRLLKNKPFKAKELIVKWNRFLLQNGPLNLNIRTVGFIQYYCLDLIALFLFALALFIWFLITLARLYYWSCFGMSRKSAHLKAE